MLRTIRKGWLTLGVLIAIVTGIGTASYLGVSALRVDDANADARVWAGFVHNVSLSEDGVFPTSGSVAVGVTPTFTAGSVTGVPMTLKGFSSAQTGDLLDMMQNGTTKLYTWGTVASAVNGLAYTAGATGTAPKIATGGTSVDATAGMTFQSNCPAGGASCTQSFVFQDSQTAPTTIFQATDVASSLNGLKLTAGATTAAPILAAIGETNVGLTLNPKGTGTVLIGSVANTGVSLTVAGNSATQTGDLLDLLQNNGGNALFTFGTVANAVNGVSFTAAATAGVAVIAANGTDATVDLSIRPKSTGKVRISAVADTGVAATVQGNSATQTGDLLDLLQNAIGNTIFKFTTASSATNGITFAGTATTGVPSITAQGTDLTVGLNINTKGAANMALDTGGAAAINIGPTNSNAVNITPNLAVTGSVAIASGTPITKIQVLTASLSPVQVAAVTCAAQTFTFTGIAINDKVVVNVAGAALNGVGIGSFRASALNTVEILFCNPTAGALTPTAAQTYTVIAFRS